MTTGFERRLTRRELLRRSLVAGGALLLSFDSFGSTEPPQSAEADRFRGGEKLAVVGFTEEVNEPIGKAFGAELDGRIYTDLGRRLDAGYYVRTVEITEL